MSDVVDQLTEMWNELLEPTQITPDSDFFDCGGTSVTAVYLAAAVQESLGVALDAIEVVKLRTFGAIAQTLSERLGA
ncbi:MAG TPA: acyl carrier protein [Actinocrinis sp.]|uniref:acyl carrier protein n=1 Tax=Actinocrinis sp. TaxID=1920516 RepID=UPI002DDD8B42|nr:acyl carrier protein [Actinocrinis sp.]HEV2343288.1 acyl carrier protein [Actinocrinis sp.]